MRYFLLLCLSFVSLRAEVEDYFKKAFEKEDHHKIRNIDFIYMINLDQRPEKFDVCRRALEPYGVYPYRFSAVNGWELSIEVLNDLGVRYAVWMTPGIKGTSYLVENKGKPLDEEPMQVFGRTYFCHRMSRGCIGIVMSHLSVLQDAFDSGYETIWVMEDDIEIIQDPHILSDLIERLDATVGKDKWDILFTDQDTKGQDGNRVICSSYAERPNFVPSNPVKCAERLFISSDFRRIGARYGAYSMIVRRSGMKKILQFFHNYELFLAYDMDYTLPPGIQLFTVLDDVVSTQPQALSDNEKPNYIYRDSR